ncbi:hypothetical protein BC936DRAFT_148716 [Jimgerdemannia flammicorona]|uniref:Uncharacterized protein n=1 Tax=Jimgerdemannia flammicorona TaxID=994334 RepID=A0A433DKK4_9FUNG|nr:hypothetical protein BC936DRAFT_148716 [Jimgerdemannia flammicorona]
MQSRRPKWRFYLAEMAQRMTGILNCILNIDTSPATCPCGLSATSMFASFTNRLLIARSFHHASAMPAKRAPKSSKEPQMDPTPPQEPQPRSPVAALTSTSTRISLLIKPNAKESRVTEVTEEWVGIAVAAPPREGEANREVVEFVAQVSWDG